MPKNAKNDIRRAQERRQRVARLYLQGLSQHAVAREVGVSQKTVCLDLAALRQEWRESAARDFDARQAEELARLNHLENVAWQAWAGSCRDAVTRHERTVENGFGTSTVSSRTVEGQTGNSRFPDQVARCVEIRFKVLGRSSQTYPRSR